MAHKIFNKFKEPKFAEFSRKDLVVDIKSGNLYYKSNLGVHRVPSEVSSNHFGIPPTSPIRTGRSTFKLDGQRSGSSAITGSLILIGNLTASGDISASGTIYANNFQSTGGDVAGISFTDDLNITGNITASGNISSSGTGSFGYGYFSNNVDIDGALTLGDFSDVSASLAAAVVGGDNLGNHTATQDLNMATYDIKNVSHITASGNISASGVLYAQDAVFDTPGGAVIDIK